MFILSLQLHTDNQFRMYWHYGGSCTRFFVQDMINLWPSYFILDENEDEYDNSSLREYISNKSMFDQLQDPNFERFYELNMPHNFSNTIPDDMNPKPARIRGKQTIEEEYKKEMAIVVKYLNNLKLSD